MRKATGLANRRRWVTVRLSDIRAFFRLENAVKIINRTLRLVNGLAFGFLRRMRLDAERMYVAFHGVTHSFVYHAVAL